jgi:two-component system sensor histidine kinase YesM
MMLISLMITLLLLAVGSVVISVLTGVLISPLRELHESIYRVNLHNLSITLEEKDSHRIVKQLNDGFKVMFQGLQNSVQEQLLSRDREAQAHMTALQNRMNPHLLHNMLSHISSLAAEEETERIEELCQRLSRSLRYLSGESGSRVTMADELHHLLDYLSLMKSHYDPLFDFSIDWDEESLKEIPVPKLIFQPLAENGFDHGFQNAEPPWRMDIRIEGSGDGGWKATFRDNGGGMSEEKQAELLAMKKLPLPEARSKVLNQPPGGLAMINMIVRLRLLYGDSIIFELDSRKGEHMVAIGGTHV